MLFIAPSTTFYPEVDGAPTGLTGTIGVRILRNSDGTTTLARTTAGIAETPAGSGHYIATLTAPSVAGEYTVGWDLGTVTPSTYVTDELTVTADTSLLGGAVGDTTDLDLVRLRVGDTDTADPLLYDDEIYAFLSAHTVISTAGTAVDVISAAADSAAAIAAKFARGYNFATDGQSFNRSERVAHYQALAKDLRSRQGGSSVPVMSSVSAAVSDGVEFG